MLQLWTIDFTQALIHWRSVRVNIKSIIGGSSYLREFYFALLKIKIFEFKFSIYKY